MLSSNIELTKITFIGVPCENEMHYRPYISNIDDTTVASLCEATGRGLNVGAQTFSSLSGRILAPSAQSHGALLLPYGWNQHRYSVLMEFDVRTAFGCDKQIVSGYTGYNGITPGGDLDPDMAIYINSHTAATPREFVGNDRIKRTMYQSKGAMQVITPVHIANRDGSGAVEAGTTLRPMDALRQCQFNHLDVNNVYDYRPDSGLHGYIPSSRDNVLGNRYLSKLCNSYRDVLSSDPTAMDAVGAGFGEAAANTAVADSSMEKQVLFSKLAGSTDFVNNKCVSIRELGSVWPQIYHDEVKYIFHTKVGAVMDKSLYTQQWGGANKETGLAYLLCQAISALMCTHLFATYSFNVTNRTLDGSINVSTSGCNFMVGVMDEINRVQKIESAIKSEIVGQIMSSGVSDFDITMRCVMLGSNDIWISINGGDTIPYSAPAYCDAVYTPVIGASRDDLNELAAGVGYMLTGMYGSNDTYSGSGVGYQGGIHTPTY